MIRLTELSVYEFFRELAKQRGFMGSKHDGKLGWQTIWRGYRKHHGMGVAGANQRSKISVMTSQHDAGRLQRNLAISCVGTPGQ